MTDVLILSKKVENNVAKMINWQITRCYNTINSILFWGACFFYSIQEYTKVYA